MSTEAHGKQPTEEDYQKFEKALRQQSPLLDAWFNMYERSGQSHKSNLEFEVKPDKNTVQEKQALPSGGLDSIIESIRTAFCEAVKDYFGPQEPDSFDIEKFEALIKESPVFNAPPKMHKAGEPAPGGRAH